MTQSNVWDAYAAIGERPRAELNDAQRDLAAVCDLRQEVNAGGFDAYFRYWGGDSAPVAVRAFASLLGQDWADLLREAMALLGPDYPTDTDTRARRLDDLRLDEQFQQLDNRYFALEADVDADARLNEYLSQTPEARS